MNRVSFIFFLSITSALYAGLHYYIYNRISTGFNFGPLGLLILKLIIILGAISFYLEEILSRRHGTAGLAKPLMWFGSVWLGIIAIAFSIYIIRDLLLIFFGGQQFRQASDIVSLFLTVLLCVFCYWNVSRGFSIKTIELKTPKLPANLDGFSIVQITDIHIHLGTSPEWVDRMVAATDSLKPDLIVMTGDLIDASICNNPALCASLSKLKAKYGVLAITGNHDFYSGIDTFMSIAADTHMKVLRNENTTIAGSIQIAGIDDPEAKSFHEGERSIPKALENPKKIDPSKPLILLSHRPDVFKEAAADGVDLMLSGHTHWGQVPPMDLLVWLTMKYSWGYYKIGNSVLYTSPGTGTWGPPMRLFSRSEIVKIILRKA